MAARRTVPRNHRLKKLSMYTAQDNKVHFPVSAFTMEGSAIAGLDFDVETDLTTQSLLLAAAHHDIPALRDLLRNSPANVKDTETGFTPLHAAIAALEPEKDDDEDPTREAVATNGRTNGDAAKQEHKPEEVEAVIRTVKFLLQHGAIWNDLDANNETPGCIARRIGLKEVYDLMVDAGVRAELLLNRLDEYQPLGDGEEDDEEEDGEEVQAELEKEGQTVEQDVSAANDTYLSHPVTVSEGQILDQSTNGVMMAWEGPIMERSAKLLLPKTGLRVLNVGHGMGMIDKNFQELSPSEHHIIEAHPDVLAQLRANGWYEKPGLTIHEGRWQDIAPKLVEQGVVFDAIYFDTFAEDYKALREFFSEYVVSLLESQGSASEGGRFGFFNGMGADRHVCYDVYQKV